MGHEQAFLDDIREHPDDDAPRLIFADWIEDHGDPERAEFIRVQCEIARLDEDAVARRRQLTKREKELWQQFGKTWSQPLRAYSKKFEFSRGFADRVTLPCKVFLDHAEDVFTLAPAATIKIREGRELASKLAACRSLAKVRSLSLNFVKLGVNRAKDFAKSPHLYNLVELDVSNNGLSTTGTEAIANAKSLTSLKRLAITSNGLGNGGVEALARSPLMGRLEILNLGPNEVRMEGLQVLAEAPGFAELKRLDLNGNAHLSNEGIGVIANSPYARGLEYLCCYDSGRAVVRTSMANVSSPEQLLPLAEALARSTTLTSLKNLDLHHCNLHDDGALDYLSSAANLPSLISLDLSRNNIHLFVGPRQYRIRESFQRLLNSPFVERLQRLDLSHNMLVGSGARIVSQSQCLKNLRYLRLSDTEVVMSAFVESPQLPALRHLDLSSNQLNDRNIEALAASPLLVQLLTLNLSRNKISTRGAKALAGSPHLRNIPLLSLEGNPFTGPAKTLLRKTFGERVALEYANESET